MIVQQRYRMVQVRQKQVWFIVVCIANKSTSSWYFLPISALLQYSKPSRDLPELLTRILESLTFRCHFRMRLKCPMTFTGELKLTLSKHITSDCVTCWSLTRWLSVNITNTRVWSMDNDHQMFWFRFVIEQSSSSRRSHFASVRPRRRLMKRSHDNSLRFWGIFCSGQPFLFQFSFFDELLAST